MYSALFLDIPNLIKTNSRQVFPIHREDWILPTEVKDIIKKHLDLNYKVFLIGNYSDVPVRKTDKDPINSLFTAISISLEKEFKMKPNSINFDYATDTEGFDYLPLPGLFYSLASDYEILLSYSSVVTNVILGKFIQQYSSVKPIIL